MTKYRFSLGFCFNEAQTQVLLARKNRPSWQAGKFNGIGGLMETKDDLDPVNCMIREFLEETGVQTTPHNWKYVGLLQGTNWEVGVYTFAEEHAFRAAQSMTSEPIGRYPWPLQGPWEAYADNMEALAGCLSVRKSRGIFRLDFATNYDHERGDKV